MWLLLECLHLTMFVDHMTLSLVYDSQPCSHTKTLKLKVECGILNYVYSSRMVGLIEHLEKLMRSW
jgi:hypothetical protein